jgi:sporulation integral membrane protein YlbJ
MVAVHILRELGFVEVIGKLLSPIMRPVFGVPGEGAFALVAGMISGYPMGAKITSELRDSNQLTQTEAQRLLSFTNNSGPLFILGTVGVAIFHSEKTGYLLMASHYFSALLVGLLFRFYSVGEISTRIRDKENTTVSARKKDIKPLGVILGSSIQQSLETIALIGGFIIFFNIFIRSLQIFAPIPDPIQKGIITGIVEMTNGINALGGGNPTRSQILAAAGLISFGGLSIHAQSFTFITKTDLNASLYIFSKLLQGVISAFIAFLLYPIYVQLL